MGLNMRRKKSTGKNYEGKKYAEILKMEGGDCTVRPSRCQTTHTHRLGREWGVVSKEEAQNLAQQKTEAGEPVQNMTFHIP